MLFSTYIQVKRVWQGIRVYLIWDNMKIWHTFDNPQFTIVLLQHYCLSKIRLVYFIVCQYLLLHIICSHYFKANGDFYIFSKNRENILNAGYFGHENSFVVLFMQVILVSATLPHEILEMTSRFMTDPVRILVKR